MTEYVIQHRNCRFLHDGYGCITGHSWSEWVNLEGFPHWTKEHAERRMKWWEELSEYARKERKQEFARTQYRVVERGAPDASS
jgi:hypothetical protein